MACSSFMMLLKYFIIFFLSVVGPESVPPSLLKVVMKPIATVGESYQYPPVNWAALLSPLMRLNFGKYHVFRSSDSAFRM